MRTILCLAAILVVCSATRPFPGSEEDNLLYQQFYGDIESTDVEIQAAAGDAACDRKYKLTGNDVISKKFFDDHICLQRGGYPTDLAAFCNDFRQGQPLYQVMVITPPELTQLRNDLTSMQVQFYRERAKVPPLLNPPSQIHFYSRDRYDFINCEYKTGFWKGKKLSGRYNQYIPKGTPGNPEATYQIYHGCPPVTSRPGDSAPGPC